MPVFHLLILALIQGLTEFLPISSSGHLVLFHELTENGDIASRWETDLMLDVAVHVGTLASVLLYFRRDLVKMLAGLKDFATGQFKNEGARLNIYIIISSIPVIIAGFALHALEPDWLRSVQVIAWTTLIFGIILWIADAKSPSDKMLDRMNVKDATLIGLAQVLALIPGTSRSGITMTMARGLGYNRSESAHYSLLLAIIAISGAGTLGALDVVKSNNAALTLDVIIAASIAFVAGFIAISVLMKWLQRATFKVFALYRICLGLGLLGGIYAGWLT